MNSNTATMCSLKLAGVSRAFGAIAAVDSVNLTLDAGSFTAMVGPSGC